MLDADFFLLLLSCKKEEQLDPSPQSRGMCPSPEFIGSRKSCPFLCVWAIFPFLPTCRSRLGQGHTVLKVTWLWVQLKCSHMTTKSCFFTSVLCSVPLWDPMNGSPSGSSVHGDSPSKNTREGTRFLLQEIFPILGWNPSLPHCRWVLYCLRHQRSPRILERVAYPFSRGTSPLRNQAGVSCIAGGFFTS